MRLVIVGFADSVHTARYLQLLEGTGWEVHLVGSTNVTHLHPELPPVSVYPAIPPAVPEGSRVAAAEPDYRDDRTVAGRVELLGRVIDEVRPHVVHSHEIQHGGVLVERLRRQRGAVGARWLVTNWGSDIFRYGRSRLHAPLIRAVLAGCDYYGSECHRDVAIARAFGLRGQVVGVWPVAGGIDVSKMSLLRLPGPTSARRAVSMKGLVGEFPQRQVILEAIERCASLLEGWELCGYQMDPRLEVSVQDLADNVGMRYTRLSLSSAWESAHDELLAMHGRSRVSLSLNRTDGLGTSFLEAMAMGSFPIHSAGSCGSELTPPGRGALFLPATDVDAVSEALRRALTDDVLVDEAAAINARVAAEHLDRRKTRARVIDAYERIACDASLALA
jgi:glycosyltransferase involved in cell wall biosynthesis